RAQLGRPFVAQALDRPQAAARAVVPPQRANRGRRYAAARVGDRDVQLVVEPLEDDLHGIAGEAAVPDGVGDELADEPLQLVEPLGRQVVAGEERTQLSPRTRRSGGLRRQQRDRGPTARLRLVRVGGHAPRLPLFRPRKTAPEATKPTAFSSVTDGDMTWSDGDHEDG